MTDPRCWNDLATENAALRAALECAAETIGALCACHGREDFDGEKRAMAKVAEWSKERKALVLEGGE